MQLLKELYNISSPSLKEKAMKKFLSAKLKALGVQYEVDKAGNIYAVKGSADSYPCIVAHMDEVHNWRNKSFEVMTMDDEIIFGFDHRINKFCGIGADDKNGIWVCLKCLEEFDVLKCAFFVGEEIGCYGSSHAKMPFFDDCRFVLQCDRRGNSDLIRYADDTELCSPEFISALQPNKYGYSVTNGLMTDVQQLKRRGLNISCVNISCGYYNPHTDNELTRFSDLNKCLDFVKHIVRDCKDTYLHTYSQPIRRYSNRGFTRWDNSFPQDSLMSEYYTQLGSLRAKMRVCLKEDPHTSLDQIANQICCEYSMLTFTDFQDVYISLANELPLQLDGI